MADRASNASNSSRSQSKPLRRQEANSAQPAQAQARTESREDKETLPTENSGGSSAGPSKTNMPSVKSLAHPDQPQSEQAGQATVDVLNAWLQLDSTSDAMKKAKAGTQYCGLFESDLKIAVTLNAANEAELITRLVHSSREKTIELEATPRMSDDFLLKLEDALSSAGTGPRLLELKWYGEADPPTFKVPTGKTLKVRSIEYSGYIESKIIQGHLKGDNELQEYRSSILDASREELAALSKGSHQLKRLELNETPQSFTDLKNMLKTKKQLEVLRLGSGKLDGEHRLKDVLAHASCLKCLILDKVKLLAGGFKDCAAAFTQSQLTAIGFSRFKSQSAEDLVQLGDGLQRAPKLASLGFFNYGYSPADAVILSAFAKNPNARQICIQGSVDQAELTAKVAGLNKERAALGLQALTLKLP